MVGSTYIRMYLYALPLSCYLTRRSSNFYSLNLNNLNNYTMGENPTCTVEEFTRTTFDYVICGGGTAGLVLAARLSENPAVTVGVIEAGKYRIGDPLVDTPAAFAQMFENPDYDWCVYTTPQVG